MHEKEALTAMYYALQKTQELMQTLKKLDPVYLPYGIGNDSLMKDAENILNILQDNIKRSETNAPSN